VRPSLSIPLLLCVLACAACSATHAAKTAPKKAPVPAPLAIAAPAEYTRPCVDDPATAEEAFECDRRSILAMAGEYHVRFAFDETAALAPGYEPHKAQRSGGTELVEVIADTGTYISLQHILVMGDAHHVIKHWRQDWRFEPAAVLRYRGKGRFETEKLEPEAVKGAWSQTVYEVDDVPRYAGIGRWVHAEGVDAWESDRVWRPLPRREYSKRSDYHALEVVNRHTLMPGGWVHEQDNTKLALRDDGTVQALARERGINRYTHKTDYDFEAGREYWRNTAPYWARIHARWKRIYAEHPTFTTLPEPDADERIEAYFDLAERAGKGEAVGDAEIDALFAKYVTY